MKGIILRQDEVKELQVTGKVVLWRDIKLSNGELADSDNIPAGGYDGSSQSYVMDFSRTYPQWEQLNCPLIKEGETRYVKETWASITLHYDVESGYCDDIRACPPKTVKDYIDKGLNQYNIKEPRFDITYPYLPDNRFYWDDNVDDRGFSWRPSVHMPEWASRYIVKCTAVTVEKRGDVWQWGIELEKATP